MPKSAKVSTVVCAEPEIAGMHPGLSHGDAWGLDCDLKYFG